jgi:hypothetical protein
MTWSWRQSKSDTILRVRWNADTATRENQPTSRTVICHGHLRENDDTLINYWIFWVVTPFSDNHLELCRQKKQTAIINTQLITTKIQPQWSAARHAVFFCIVHSRAQMVSSPVELGTYQNLGGAPQQKLWTVYPLVICYRLRKIMLYR